MGVLRINKWSIKVMDMDALVQHYEKRLKPHTKMPMAMCIEMLGRVGQILLILTPSDQAGF